MNILEIADDIYLIDLPMELEGYRKFISSWVIKKGERAVLVDIGPAATVPKLIESVKFLGVRDVEFVLLTHIHLDHAGGVGEVVSAFPDAKVVVHEKGKKHLVNPEKLWRASKEVLGEVADAYGKPKPIPEESIYDGEVEFGGEVFEVVDTPGHASHHQSYVYGEFLFVGEALGVHMPLKNDYYLRPATPPRFVYEVAMDSIEKINEFGSLRVCFAHFGFKRDSVEIAETAAKQLELWVETVYDIACRRDFDDEKEIISIAKTELLEKDRRFSRYYLLDADIRKREDYYIQNSLKGILHYVWERFCAP
ncbi:MAG: MBL fold metallo-hydrolase [Archaeoglobaceae archaeon]